MKRDSARMFRNQRHFRVGDNRANVCFISIKHNYLDSYSYAASLHRRGTPGSGSGCVAAGFSAKWDAGQLAK